MNEQGKPHAAELSFDVAIIGGGLAGGMASTLLQRHGLRTIVLEARPTDRPEKIVVGEAMTEGTSVFLRHELGLTDWLKKNAFRKFGFDFLTLPRNAPPPQRFEDCNELLLSLKPLEQTPAALRRLIPTYHVDRPPMNRHLGQLARDAGATWIDGASVEQVDLAPTAAGTSTVHFQVKDGEAQQLSCRYVLDCSGRRAMLGRQLDILHPVAGLNTAAVWNRFSHVGADPAVWRTFGGVDRRQHTIHMTGPGFWIWWIHQSDKMTSVGVSYDRDQHNPNVKTEDRGFWEMLRKFPPILAQLAGAQALEPFQYYAHLPYECDHWVSARGYALIGDAGWFTDALYSVGIETACRQLANLAPLVVAHCRGQAPAPQVIDRLNEEFTYARKTVQKMNTFKYQHGWARPHVVAQTAIYELGDIQELYHLQDRAQWTPENRASYYHLPWYNRDRFQRLSNFLDQSLVDGERDLLPDAPLLKKALLPDPLVYLTTWPLWHLRKGPSIFFKIIRWWSFSERLTQRRRLWPDGLSWMARAGDRRALAAAASPRQLAAPMPTAKPAPERLGSAPSPRTLAVPPPASFDPARISQRFDGQVDFERVLLPRLRAHRLFRLATPEELEPSFLAYKDGDAAQLLATWEAVASPVRATLPGLSGLMHRHAHLLPRRVLGLACVATMRGVLDAGRRFRSTLRPEVSAAIDGEFPWLKHRHEHIPPGPIPALDFPPEFAEFLQSGTLDDTRARWQLTVALNEIQQAHSSRHLARQFGLTELELHADRERELALNYFAHWSPRVTRSLWAQCIYILDGLNAAVYAALEGSTGLGIRARAMLGLVSGDNDWRTFCQGLDEPQVLLPPPAYADAAQRASA